MNHGDGPMVGENCVSQKKLSVHQKVDKIQGALYELKTRLSDLRLTVSGPTPQNDSICKERSQDIHSMLDTTMQDLRDAMETVTHLEMEIRG